MHKKYRVIKGDDGKYKLTKSGDKPVEAKESMADALEDRIKREKEDTK